MSASAADRPMVYVPELNREGILQQNPRAIIVVVDDPTEIMPGTRPIGPMELEYSRKILFVGGGLHLRSLPHDEVRRISSWLREHGVEQLAPFHCTGGDAVDTFRQEWGEGYHQFYLGDSFTF